MADLPTDKQLALLRKRNYTGPAPQTKQEASGIISELLGTTNSFTVSTNVAKEKQQTVFGQSNEKEVKWEKPSPDMLQAYEELLATEQRMESLAYHIVKSLHPEMSVNSQTFGMIVSAKEDKLIHLLALLQKKTDSS